MKDARERMILTIKRNYGLDSPKVLSAMNDIPREKFVPRKYQYMAYYDGPVSIGFGQTMSQPYTVAFMTHNLISAKGKGQRAKGKEQRAKSKGYRKWKVLEIGTGSGYQAAVLSKLVKEVYSVEIIPQLVRKARRIFEKLKYNSVYVRASSGEYGWKAKSPFDAIIITAALEKEVPKELISQLKVGGTIVAPIGPRHLQTMTRFTKLKNGKLKKEEFEKYVFVPFVKERN